MNSHNQDGASNNAQTSSDINYEPSRQLDLKEAPEFKAVETKLVGTVQQKAISNPRNFYQAGVLYRSLSEQDKQDLITNLAGDLNKVNDEEIKATMVSHFYRADKDYGTRLANATNTDMKQVMKKATM